LSNETIRALAESVLNQCRAKKLMLATAESCTGGLIVGALTDIAGSSDVVDRAFVTYSNRAKTEMLSVPAALLAWHGAVSAEVARAMATGVLAHAPVDLAVAVTGVAGPGGGSADKPVGLVHFAVVRRGNKVESEQRVFPGDRDAIRRATVEHALEMLRDAAKT
jgi:nicotinamide-nucleotide amidase